MKTIEEVEREVYGKDEVLVSQGRYKSNFLKGVEFAQRWIPVEEELPESFSIVLVRDNGISPIISTALFQDGEFFPDFLLEHGQVTHWRPIDLK